MQSKFGDLRLEKRYRSLQAALLEKPHSRLPQVGLLQSRQRSN